MAATAAAAGCCGCWGCCGSCGSSTAGSRAAASAVSTSASEASTSEAATAVSTASAAAGTKSRAVGCTPAAGDTPAAGSVPAPPARVPAAARREPGREAVLVAQGLLDVHGPRRGRCGACCTATAPGLDGLRRWRGGGATAGAASCTGAGGGGATTLGTIALSAGAGPLIGRRPDADGQRNDQRHNANHEDRRQRAADEQERLAVLFDRQLDIGLRLVVEQRIGRADRRQLSLRGRQGPR